MTTKQQIAAINSCFKIFKTIELEVRNGGLGFSLTNIIKIAHNACIALANSVSVESAIEELNSIKPAFFPKGEYYDKLKVAFTEAYLKLGQTTQ
jgi:hypothetical protein